MYCSNRAKELCNEEGYACPLNVFKEEFIRKMSTGLRKLFGNMQLAIPMDQSFWTYNIFPIFFNVVTIIKVDIYTATF